MQWSGLKDQQVTMGPATVWLHFPKQAQHGVVVTWLLHIQVWVQWNSLVAAWVQRPFQKLSKTVVSIVSAQTYKNVCLLSIDYTQPINAIDVQPVLHNLMKNTMFFNRFYIDRSNTSCCHRFLHASTRIPNTHMLSLCVAQIYQQYMFLFNTFYIHLS